MLTNLTSSMRWLLSLGRRFLRVVPFLTLYSVAATLLSQLTLLLAFVLPLKVILLLGSDGIPRYFPEQFKEFDRQSLILALSALAIVLYVVHLVAERVISICVANGSQKLLVRSRKMVLFENQDEMAAKSYQRFSRGLASVVFIVAFVPLLVWLNLYLAGIFVSYAVLAVAVCLVLARFNKGFESLWLSGRNRVPALLGSVGFLLCFAFMVAEFLWLVAPSVLVAVVCLLLLRQLFKHLVSIVNDVVALVEKRRQLSALFFHGQRLLEAPRHGSDGLWSKVEPSIRDEWLGQALVDATGHRFVISAVRWLQLGVADVIAYRVVAAYGEKEQCFLVKLYEHNRSAMAKHEASLLAEQNGLPSLQLIGVTDVASRYHCHVFALDSARQALGKKWPVRCEVARTTLLACQPNEDLTAMFRRSKPCLAQRMERDVLRRMRCLLSDASHLKALDTYEINFDAIRALLSSLPLAYVNPDIRRGLVMLDDFNQVLVCHWARWSLEPVGCGWPVDDRAMGLLKEAWTLATSQRTDMAGVTLQQLKLSALLYAFEKCYKQQDYHGAAELLPGINKYFSIALA